MAKVVFLIIGLIMFYPMFKMPQNWFKPVMIWYLLVYFAALILDQYILAVLLLVGYLYTRQRIVDWLEREEKLRKIRSGDYEEDADKTSLVKYKAPEVRKKS